MDSVLRSCLRAIKRAAYASLIGVFAIGGALIGSVSGALKGQTTETGFFRGAAIGAVAGAVLSFEVLDSCLQGDLLSKVAIFDSLINGKIFREWVSPAMLKAYQWQITTLETSDGDAPDIFETDSNKGLPPGFIKKLPAFKIISGKKITDVSCAICLQDFDEGQSARRLPICGHVFHMLCIDKWLDRHGSCPICRHDLQ